MKYDPAQTPSDVNQIVTFLDNELQKLKNAINETDYIKLQILNVAPARPEIGIYAADGTNWNPGAGAGVYYFNGSTYTKL